MSDFEDKDLPKGAEVPEKADPNAVRLNIAASLVRSERVRQISEEGWSPEHDDNYHEDELARAAASYALPEECRRHTAFSGSVPPEWPWDSEYWKPTPDDRVRELVKAGALILAAIEHELRKKEENSDNGEINGKDES